MLPARQHGLGPFYSLRAALQTAHHLVVSKSSTISSKSRKAEPVPFTHPAADHIVILTLTLTLTITLTVSPTVIRPMMLLPCYQCL